MTEPERRAALDLVAAELGMTAAGVKALVALIRDDAPSGGSELVGANEIAQRFGMSRDWVYDHASDLGAVRLGAGPRPRLAFDTARVKAFIDRQATASAAPTRRAQPQPGRRRRTATTSVALLPIGPRKA